jgi:3-carboxy-cis,cis-muconate cycloisomerase
MPNNASNRGHARIYDPLFSTPEVSAVVRGQALIVQMLRFEWALAGALEKNGIIPSGVSAVIETITTDDLDIDSIAEKATNAGNLAIPFVSQLTKCVAEKNPSLAAYVHWGATSQDVLDTASVLQTRQVLELLQEDLNATAAALIPLIRTHASTLLPGRTWLQQGPPVTFGLKLAGWLDALQRHRLRLRGAASRCAVLQFGGAVGTLAALGEYGPAVTRDLGRALGLSEAAIPWHTHRDRVAEIAATLGLLTGTLGKIARDFSLLMQTEVSEAFEPAGEGRGGSSTMPHKRNPVSCSVVLAAAARMPGLVSTMLIGMVQEHERGLGGWQAEWETLVEIFRVSGGALRAIKQIVTELTVDVIAMRQHIDANGGIALAEAVSFALAQKIGKAEAHHFLERVVRVTIEQHSTLRESLLASAEVRKHLSFEEIDYALDPAQYLGSASVFIANVLAHEDTL